MIRLVISDVDGTLLTPQKQITALSEKAVADLVAENIRFTLISSRPPRGMQWIVEQLDIREPIAAFNGAVIFSSQSEVLFASYIAPKVADAVIHAASMAGASVWVYTADQWLVLPNQPAHIDRESATVRFSPTVVESFSPFLAQVVKVQAVSDDQQVIARCESAVQAIAKGDVSATRSQSYYYDVTPPGGNKGAGVARLCSRLDVPLHAAATIGDMQNDIPMLVRAGFSVAMGQATIEVKSAARRVARSNAEEGFADAIYRFILHRKVPATIMPAKSA